MEFKREIDESMSEDCKYLSKKMNNLKETNSKEYWKLLNMRKYRNKPNISINCFFEFFKNV